MGTAKMGEDSKGASKSNDAEIEETFRSPLGVTADEEDGAEGPIRVSVIIPGIKKKIFNNQELSNGSVLFKPEERTLDLRVVLVIKLSSSNSREEKYRYNIRKLPDDIVPEQCTYKVKKGQIVLKLYKSKPRSWSRDLSETGLETDIETEGEDPVGDF